MSMGIVRKINKIQMLIILVSYKCALRLEDFYRNVIFIYNIIIINVGFKKKNINVVIII